MQGTAQHLHVLSVGTGDLSAFFFPNGIVGRINTTVGYNLTDPGMEDFPYSSNVAGQVATVLMCATHCTPYRCDWPGHAVGYAASVCSMFLQDPYRMPRLPCSVEGLQCRHPYLRLCPPQLSRVVAACSSRICELVRVSHLLIREGRGQFVSSKRHTG